MVLNFRPLSRNRYRCVQYPKIVVKKGSLEQFRFFMAGRTNSSTKGWKEREPRATSRKEKRKSGYRNKRK